MIKYSLQNFSRIGEDLAARYLVTNGYSVVCRNFRKRCGEIDLIVEKDQHLIFCEVKTRTSHSIESALSSVSFSKQRKITRAAQLYINENQNFGNYIFRFDVILVFYYESTDTFKVIPVSYTHLRAHETVLDLVCRLLLEKKKTP